MPTYVYHCTSCDKTFEAKQRMSDKPLSSCECGSEGTVSRQMGTGAGIIFKGSGFYETDYKKKDSGSSTASSSTSSSTSSTKTETKSEAPSTGGGCSDGSCGSKD